VFSLSFSLSRSFDLVVVIVERIFFYRKRTTLSKYRDIDQSYLYRIFTSLDGVREKKKIMARTKKKIIRGGGGKMASEKKIYKHGT